MKKITILALVAAMVAGIGSAGATNHARQTLIRPVMNMCFAELKPMKPLFCSDGYTICMCVNPYDHKTCHWVWVCR